MTHLPVDIDQVYRAHGNVVLRRATQILKNEHDAKEVLQEIFLSLIDRPEQFEGRSSLTTWLYRATTNRCLNIIRNRKTRRRLLEERALSQHDQGGSLELEGHVNAILLLAKLPKRLAVVAVYYYSDGMNRDEIAEVVGCSPRKVGYLLKELSERIAKYGRAK
jgi:RNA polymerase sigma-70 factor (ECF subfamily)